jgi:DNA-binding NarL/FixJ family response regulator
MMTDPLSAADRSGPIAVLLVDDQSLLREGLRTLLELQPDLRIVGETGDGIAAEALVERLRPDVVLMDLRMPRCDGVEATRRIVGRWPAVQVLVLTTFDEDELVFRSIEAGAAGYLLKDVGSDALGAAIRAVSRGESPIQPSVARKLLGRLRATSQVGTLGGAAGDRSPDAANRQRLGTRAGQPGTEPPHPGDPAPVGQPGTEPPHPGDPAPVGQPPPVAEPLTQRDLDVLRLLGAGATNREIAEQLSLTDGTVKNYVSTLLGKTGLRDRTQLAVWAIHHGFS